MTADLPGSPSGSGYVRTSRDGAVLRCVEGEGCGDVERIHAVETVSRREIEGRRNRDRHVGPRSDRVEERLIERRLG